MNNVDLSEFKKNAESAVQLLKKMAHKDRLLILCHLVDGEMSAGDLSRRSLLSQSAFSQHLAILRENNIIITRRESQSLYYSISNADVVKVLHTLKQIFCE